MLQSHDVDTIGGIIQACVDRIKQTYGEDKFCEGVSVALELKFENPLLPGKIATKYMTLGSDEQYMNMSCYMMYLIAMSKAKSMEDIEPSIVKICDGLKELVLKYNKDNPYQP